MSPQELEAWIQAAAVLYTVGGIAVEKIGAAIHVVHPAMSETELNDALETIKADARVRKAIADADAGQGPNV